MIILTYNKNLYLFPNSFSCNVTPILYLSIAMMTMVLPTKVRPTTTYIRTIPRSDRRAKPIIVIYELVDWSLDFDLFFRIATSKDALVNYS